MNITQLYTGCLAQGAYYIESDGEAAIIDPLREVQQYIDRAADSNATIKYVFETHFHADFVSGHVTLAEKTGADIVYGPLAAPTFDCIVAEDGQEFKLGSATIKVLHTPGHTMESTTYLLRDADGKDHAIFSGDTLFLGDVGRPDLAQKAADLTQEQLAATLYQSLRTKIMTLADEVIVYPGHGAGSACGKKMSDETVGTIGDQKATNYALRADMTEAEFVKEVTDGLLPPPAYFPLNVKLNKEGYDSIDAVLEKGLRPLSPAEFEAAANETGAVMLDVRHQDVFTEAHVPRSIFIGLNGSFAPWVGALIADVKQPILLIVEDDQREEAITRLSRVGFDSTIGYLHGGIAAWKAAGKETDSIKNVSPAELATEHAANEALRVIDVRKPTEFVDGHVTRAENFPLDNLNDYLASFPKTTAWMHCRGGYRSVIAASMLKARGIHNLVNVTGGYTEIVETTIATETGVQPSALS